MAASNWLFLLILLQLSWKILCQDFHDTSLVINNLNIPYPIISYGGVSAIYNNTLFGWNGIQCVTQSKDTGCPSTTNNLQYTLDISSISIPKGSKTISLSNNPTWAQNNVSNHNDRMIDGVATSSSTYLDNFAWILHPGCCGPEITTFSNLNYALKYDLQSNTYESLTQYKALIPGGNTIGESCNANDGTSYIYTIGGRYNIAPPQSVYATVYRYHFRNDIWQQIDDLNIARFNPSCTFVEGILYVLGGQTGQGALTRIDSIEVYDDTLDKWTVIAATLYEARNQAVSYSHPNNWIITIGGRNSNAEYAKIELFEPSTGYVATTNITYPVKRFYHSRLIYDINTYVIFLWGGNDDVVVYDQILYIVMSSDDSIFPTNSPTISPLSITSTTISPSTITPSTVAPTNTPTTITPSTITPTDTPTTISPSTITPTTMYPSTTTPTSIPPTTAQPSTLKPSTYFPTSSVPTTAVPISNASTTSVPTTAVPTRHASTTSISVPITITPTTSVPTTSDGIICVDCGVTLNTTINSMENTEKSSKVNNNNKETFWIIIAAVAVLFLCTVVSIICFWYEYKRKKKKSVRNASSIQLATTRIVSESTEPNITNVDSDINSFEEADKSKIDILYNGDRETLGNDEEGNDIRRESNLDDMYITNPSNITPYGATPNGGDANNKDENGNLYESESDEESVEHEKMYDNDLILNGNKTTMGNNDQLEADGGNI